MKTWKVKYTDMETMLARHPFFKHTVYVAAETRKDAIERVKNYLYSDKYDRFSASPSDSKPDCMFS